MGAKTSKKTYDNALAMLHRYMEEHNMRNSPVREMVLNEICQMPQPFTAEHLQQVCSEDHISAGTVYNALRLFLGIGILHAIKRQRGNTSVEYELVCEKRTRMQVICEKCGRITSFHDKAIDTLVQSSRRTNFIMDHFVLTLYGECKKCKKITKITTT
jgi:Fe2+ or Zn2+ uptake regulation protein